MCFSQFTNQKFLVFFREEGGEEKAVANFIHFLGKSLTSLVCQQTSFIFLGESRISLGCKLHPLFGVKFNLPLVAHFFHSFELKSNLPSLPIFSHFMGTSSKSPLVAKFIHFFWI